MLQDLKYMIKVIPFYIAGIYLLYMGICLFPIQESTLLISDLFVYAGPTYAIPMLLLSNRAHFCKWHRIAILIPLLGVLSGAVDSYILKYNIFFEYANLIVLLCLTAITIFSGIKVLWRKE